MSGQTTLRWIPGGNRFVSTDSTGHSVVMSTPKENSGMKPSELILSALAGCASVDVVDILAKKRTPSRIWKFRSALNRTPTHPGPFARFM